MINQDFGWSEGCSFSWNPSMGRGRSYFLDQDRNADGGWLYNLHERVWHEDICGENGTAESPRGVDRVGRRCIDFFDMASWTSDRDASGIGIDLHELFALGEISRDT